MSVCFNCGAMKVGAYKPCDACSVAPRKTANHVYSLLLTDHYLPREELDRISEATLSGGPRPSLPEQLLEKLGKDADRYRGTAGPLYVADNMFTDVIAAKAFPDERSLYHSLDRYIPWWFGPDSTCSCVR